MRHSDVTTIFLIPLPYRRLSHSLYLGTVELFFEIIHDRTAERCSG